MRLDKFNAYAAKETLGYRGRKSYMAVAEGAAKREEKQREETTKALQQGGERNPFEQNRVNEEKNKNT